jgi:hypothetical protein
MISNYKTPVLVTASPLNPLPVVVISSGIPAFDSTFNSYSEGLVPFDTPTTILTYTVPALEVVYVLGMVCWGDTDGEFFIYVDGIQRGGGRTTAATPTFTGDYTAAPISATAAQVITIKVNHYNPASKTMKANLLGGIVNI